MVRSNLQNIQPAMRVADVMRHALMVAYSVDLREIDTPVAMLVVLVVVAAVNNFLISGYSLPTAITTSASPPIAELRTRVRWWGR